jgi:hypothetical protein
MICVLPRRIKWTVFCYKFRCKSKMKGSEENPKTRLNTGTPGRNRTCDPLLRRQLLYPLSYRRACGKIKMERETGFEPATPSLEG